MIRNGELLIQERIDQAVAAGRNEAVIREDCEIAKTIRLPSDFTLILEDCRLTMAEGTFCNMFANGSRGTGGIDRNIALLGRGRAVIDGGVYNGLSEKNSLKDGRPHISVNSLLLFSGVEGFRVENLSVVNQRWWALAFFHCWRGVIRDLDFCADWSWFDGDGNRHWGLDHVTRQVYIRNADGIDLRAGCHDILIERITGFTEDDSVALTGLDGEVERMFDIPGLPDDIHDVTVRDVRTASYCAMIRLLNQDGVKLYDITVDGVRDASAESPCVDRCVHAVRIGDGWLYGKVPPAKGDTRNITVRNVLSRAEVAVELAGPIVNLTLESIEGFDGCGELIRNNAELSTE